MLMINGVESELIVASSHDDVEVYIVPVKWIQDNKIDTQKLEDMYAGKTEEHSRLYEELQKFPKHEPYQFWVY
jgi:hypothetical protein